MLGINYAYRRIISHWGLSLLLHGLLLLLIKGMAGRQETRVGVSADGSSEQQDEWLRFVDLVVNPAARLLHTEGAPLVLCQQSLLRHLLENVLREKHVAILVHVVLILLWILNLFWEMWHVLLLLSVNLFFEFIYNIEIFKCYNQLSVSE